MAGGELSESQVDQLKEIFALFDVDGDGTITAKKLGIVMTTLGYPPTDNELQDMIKHVDNSGYGKIDESTFLKMMETRILNDTQSNEDELREVFSVLDVDGNGFISPSELRNVMTNLSEDDVTEMIKEADYDEDGQINFEEFMKFMASTTI
ncbi:neo-calmodulin-like [Tubulanus polymorphus]|uniref:neo-calmodulin-like n=1 Tax=Tubulanus polymorphus TaxID=672921 RepID=UPI003DA2A12E